MIILIIIIIILIIIIVIIVIIIIVNRDFHFLLNIYQLNYQIFIIMSLFLNLMKNIKALLLIHYRIYHMNY